MRSIPAKRVGTLGMVRRPAAASGTAARYPASASDGKGTSWPSHDSYQVQMD